MALLLLLLFGGGVKYIDAKAASQSEAVSWAQSKLNVGLDYDGQYGCQCVDLIYYYYQYLGVTVQGGNANAYAWNNLPSGWQRISYSNGYVPQPGDIAVWKTNHYCNTCTTGEYGHIGIVISADSNGFNCINQNSLSRKYCTYDWYPNSALQCVIRPKFTQTISVSKTETCDYRVTIPANYKLVCYWSASTQTEADRWINGKTESYTLKCDQKCTLSDGSIRYRFKSGDGYTLYFVYNSNNMSLKTNHSFTTIIKAAATCTTKGSKQEVCSKCGATGAPKTIAALGHSYSTSYTIDQAATCTEAGSKSRHCTRCSSTTGVVVIEALGHDLSGAWKTQRQATCTAMGIKTRNCKRCTTYSQLDLIAATGHSWGSWSVVRESTTSADGLKSRKCSKCSETETQTIAKLPSENHKHSYGKWKTIEEATCVSQGSAERVCNSCGGKETKVLSSGEHVMNEWTETIKSTCSVSGEEKRECITEGCDYSETRVSNMKKHDFGIPRIIENASKEKDGIQEVTCTVCGKTEMQTIKAEKKEKNIEKQEESTKGIFDRLKNSEGSTHMIVLVAIIIGGFLTIGVGVVGVIVATKIKKKEE